MSVTKLKSDGDKTSPYLDQSVRLGINETDFRRSEGIIYTLEPRASYFIVIPPLVNFALFWVRWFLFIYCRY